MKLKQLLVYSMMFVAVLACTAQVSQSTLVIPSSLDYMTGKADTIISGTIGESHGYWENKRIFTGVSVEVREYIKSADPAQPKSIELKVMGGQVGDKRLDIDQAPRFFPGEEVLLFLSRQGDKYLVYGIYYGVCRVVKGDDGVSKHVTGPVFAKREVQNLATRQVKPNPLPAEGEKLESFVKRIKDLVD